MIIYKTGNILNDEAQALVNPVNCVGVMGAGLALAFKNKYKDYFNYYKYMCGVKKIKIGKVDIYKNYDKYLISFPTKYHWREKSNIKSIELGLADLVNKINLLDIKSIAIPALGCGCGGLNWSDVNKMMIKYLYKIDCSVIIYKPNS